MIIEVQEETTWFIQNDLQNTNTRGFMSCLNSVSLVNGSSLDYLGRKQMALIIIIMGFELIKRRPCSRKHFLCTFIGTPPPSYQSPLLLAIGWLYSTEKRPKSQILSQSSGYSAYRIPRIIFFKKHLGLWP